MKTQRNEKDRQVFGPVYACQSLGHEYYMFLGIRERENLKLNRTKDEQR